MRLWRGLLRRGQRMPTGRGIYSITQVMRPPPNSEVTELGVAQAIQA